MNASRTMAKMIEESNGKMVTVEWIKNNGELRKLNGRMGVKKGTKGGVRTTDPAKYICIHENNNGFRNINKDIIISLSCNGVKVTAS